MTTEVLSTSGWALCGFALNALEAVGAERLWSLSEFLLH